MKITDPYSPTIVPSVFTTKIDNPYFPLTPGTRTISEAATADGLHRTTTDVTRDTRKVMGVDTVVVHDTVTVDNEPLEDTFDWYAQDRDGNVWYFGEVTKEYKDGSVDTAGSFEGGVNGALPGIIMPAHPQVGDQYRQEFLKNVAEDTARVLSLDESTCVTYGCFDGVLLTEEKDRLDPGVVDHKFYAKGIGSIFEQTVKGGDETIQLVSISH